MSEPIPVLIVDDLEPNRKLLKVLLKAEGYPVLEAENGTQALELLRSTPGPLVGLIDWEMPGPTGVEVCAEIKKEKDKLPPRFLILLTVRDARQDIVTGLKSGVNDYVTKPFDQSELLARIAIGMEMVTLQTTLAQRVDELQHAMAEIKQLNGLVPICSYCKKIRDDKNYWHQLERYISSKTDAKFSHGICPDCYETVVKKELEEMEKGEF
ncbi:Response regulator receiver domain-containing protein [Verrucomicrobium sp. GAS474]|uniref:response regulator transcription factor n=1 Tax=Verrucomicrobium sp. GAS474 TaxID=1882831 RepID=UPI00087A91ED|nr:response regulator transcription factor [Verrucomicrobium sp. GAS474]SDT97029.1 Response regulator receiver domain-containing protein [Verrucomicrobium sp. GAS474]